MEAEHLEAAIRVREVLCTIPLDRVERAVAVTVVLPHNPLPFPKEIWRAHDVSMLVENCDIETRLFEPREYHREPCATLLCGIGSHPDKFECLSRAANSGKAWVGGDCCLQFCEGCVGAGSPDLEVRARHAYECVTGGHEVIERNDRREIEPGAHARQDLQRVVSAPESAYFVRFNP